MICTKVNLQIGQYRKPPTKGGFLSSIYPIIC